MSFRIVAHRGTPGGMIPENTSAAALVAHASGADDVEIDVTCSTDGVLYAFHDGTEPKNLGISSNLATMSSAEIDSLCYLDSQLDGAAVPVQRLSTLLDALLGTGLGIHVDRSWPHWDRVIPELAAANMNDQLLMKACAQHLDQLASHEIRWRMAVIVETEAELELALTSELPIAVVELVAEDPTSPLVTPAAVQRVHDVGYAVMVNAEVVGAPRFAGYDDQVSILQAPEHGWGKLVELGVDLIQTDFPWLLAAWRDAQG